MLVAKIFRIEFGTANSCVILAIALNPSRGPLDAAYAELLDKVAGQDQQPGEDHLLEAMAVLKRHVDACDLEPTRVIADKVKTAALKGKQMAAGKQVVTVALMPGSNLGFAHVSAVQERLEGEWDNMPSGSTIQLSF